MPLDKGQDFPEIIGLYGLWNLPLELTKMTLELTLFNNDTTDATCLIS